MRVGVVAVLLPVAAGLCAAAQAQSPDGARPYKVVDIARSGEAPPRELAAAVRPESYREYRIEPSSYADRSAHTRALDEMNAINNRRPRAFRFRPVMALTFDAADLDGPTRMAGIAPSLIGIKRKR